MRTSVPCQLIFRKIFIDHESWSMTTVIMIHDHSGWQHRSSNWTKAIMKVVSILTLSTCLFYEENLLLNGVALHGYLAVSSWSSLSGTAELGSSKHQKKKKKEKCQGMNVGSKLHFWRKTFLVSSSCSISNGSTGGNCLTNFIREVLLLLWYILRGLSSSEGLIRGLSSVVQKKQDNRKERKTKRKKKVKKKKEKKKLEGKPRRKSQNRQEEGKTDAPVQDWKLKTQRKSICFVERMKKRPEGRNTAKWVKNSTKVAQLHWFSVQSCDRKFAVSQTVFFVPSRESITRSGSWKATKPGTIAHLYLVSKMN